MPSVCQQNSQMFYLSKILSYEHPVQDTAEAHIKKVGIGRWGSVRNKSKCIKVFSGLVV